MKLRRIESVMVAVALCSVAFMPAQVSAQNVNKKGKVFPAVKLPKEVKGEGIPGALGASLHAVADWYGHSDAELEALCRRDKSLAVDRSGRLHYVCAGTAPALGSSSGWGMNGTIYPAPYPDAQTFLLHSRPGATKVIYLDFKGHTTSGTYWNSSYNGGADIVTPPYDIDGNPASFSSTEQANIQLIWQAVAEDFAPFDVDVTTEDPGVEALRKTSPSDTFYGIRICIGGSSQDWLKQDAGGIAYYFSFDWSTDTPAFVFPAQLGAGNPKFVAEAAAHEAGHTVGLHHEGLNNGTEYYTGQGNWAPIMGAGYYCDVTQWSKGEYNFANNFEDQLALISAYLPYIPDAVGNDTAHALSLAGSSFSTPGMIGATADVDAYSFATGTGNVSITAAPATPFGNANLLLSLYDSNGTFLTSVGPTTAAAGATLAQSLSAGTYYLSVTGVGSGNPQTDGYSNYASLGQFTLNGTVVPSNNQPPVAAASGTPTSGTAPMAVAFSSAGSSDPDGTIASYSWNFGDGTTSTAANPSHTYAAGSYTATLTVKDNFGANSAPATVAITVAPANQKPVAVASATPASGTAPLVVAFSSAGSSDPDGTIASYSWNFGDGTTSTAANPSHTYAAGSYTATLIVTDNQGLASTPASVAISVAPANQQPVAVASATPTTGTAPVTVTFSSAGSNDPDGTIASYSWNFGDGTTSTASNPSHTYAAGTYTATLTVTDNKGLASLPVSVVITSKAKAVYVGALTITATKNAKGQSIATAVVTVKDQTGAIKPNASVVGKWSGLTTGTSTVKTNAQGQATFKSAATTNKGTFTFTVSGITLSGYVYDSSQNVLTSISIASP